MLVVNTTWQAGWLLAGTEEKKKTSQIHETKRFMQP